MATPKNVVHETNETTTDNDGDLAMTRKEFSEAHKQLQSMINAAVEKLADKVEQAVKQQVAQEVAANKAPDAVAPDVMLKALLNTMLEGVVPVEKHEDFWARQKNLFAKLKSAKADKVPIKKVQKASYEAVENTIGMMDFEDKVQPMTHLTRGEAILVAVATVGVGVGVGVGVSKLNDRRELRAAGKTESDKKAWLQEGRNSNIANLL